MKPARIFLFTILYVSLTFLYTSCVREDTGDSHAVRNTACGQWNARERIDFTQSGVLEKSEVYLFGENGFVRMVPAGVSSDYLFGNHKEARLTLVAWGNIKEDSPDYRQNQTGNPARGSTPETETTCRRKPFACY